MTNVIRFEAHEPSRWKEWLFQHPALEKPARGKLFLGERLGLKAMEVSLNSLPRGVAMPFSHRHRANEELYLFLAGRGEMTVDGETFEVCAGSAVGVQPEGVRTWRNVGDEPLVYVVVQASPQGGLVRGIADGEVVPA
jgi:mannose-6-phosphate isomerase-like protein (cupin superfamily)